uniref:Uncharacterized protein n=1 Tax=Salix viminalis TaxID=40686 RepID=A0A6N2LEX1_SALVM
MITSPFHILFLSSELNCRRLLQCLAMALYESVTCGTFWASKKKDLADEDSESKQRTVNELVLNEGTKSILKTVNFELHVHEPFFTQLEDGLKTIEGNCAVGDNNRIHRHASFLETMQAEGLEKVLPERLEFTAQPYISLARILPASHRAS